MKQLINKRLLLVYGASIASIGYVFSIATTSIAIGIFLFFWLINFRELNFNFFLKLQKIHFLTLLFLLLLLGLMYSLDTSQGLKEVSKQISFLLFPLVFLTIKPFKEKERFIIKRLFIYSLSILFCLCLLNALYRQTIRTIEGSDFNWYFFYRYDFLELFNQHPTYISMYTILSIGFLLDKGKAIIKSHKTLILTLLIQGLAIVLYGSRIGYILLFIILLLFIVKDLKTKEKKLKRYWLIGYFSVLLLVGYLSWSIPIVKERIQFTFGYQKEYKYNDKEEIKNNSPEEDGRLLLWKDAVDLISMKPIFGYGTGSNRKVLLEKYKKEGHHLFFEKRYNVHNTYLELLISGGIPLLLAFLCVLGSLAYHAKKQNDYNQITFLLIISIASMTETIFLSQGIAFLSFFYCFNLTKKLI